MAPDRRTRRARRRPEAYRALAEIYDRVYSFKDYDAEARTLRGLIRKWGPRPSRTLLDVGCGTGTHLERLAGTYEVTGIDASPAMLRIARRKLPAVRFRLGRMESFDLGKRYDVVTCLFSAIGYMRTPAALHRSIRRFASHMEPGGLLIVEPWIEPGNFHLRHPHLLTVNDPDLKVARLSFSSRRGGVSVLEMRYLVATEVGLRDFVEHHTMGLFTRAQMREAFVRAGLSVRYQAKGLMGRGLYIGRKPTVTRAAARVGRARRSP